VLSRATIRYLRHTQEAIEEEEEEEEEEKTLT